MSDRRYQSEAVINVCKEQLAYLNELRILATDQVCAIINNFMPQEEASLVLMTMPATRYTNIESLLRC